MPGFSHKYDIKLINSTQQLVALKHDWTEVLVRSSQANIFLTWEWCYTWWKHFGANNDLWLLVAHDPEGTAIGLAPLYRRRGQLAFIGDNDTCPDHLDFIARMGEEKAVFASLVAALGKMSNSWTQLEIGALRADSLLFPLLREISGGRYFERPGAACPYIVLPREWEAYRHSLSANTRYNIGRYRRKLEKCYPNQVSFHQVTTSEALADNMNSLVHLHTKAWRSRGKTGTFARPGFEAFHRDFAARALEQNWLRFYTLEVSGHAVSALYCFRYGDTMSYYQSGYDPDWRAFSVGRLLMAHAIQQAIAEGVREFDLLRGEESYKYQWTGLERHDLQVQVASNRLQAKMLWMVSIFGHQMKEAVQRILPPRLQKALRYLRH